MGGNWWPENAGAIRHVHFLRYFPSNVKAISAPLRLFQCFPFTCQGIESKPQIATKALDRLILDNDGLYCHHAEWAGIENGPPRRLEIPLGPCVSLSPAFLEWIGTIVAARPAVVCR